MPNWCNNEMWVRGPSEELKKFKEKAKGDKTDLSLCSLFPEPIYKKEDAWYDWRISNWGCKWDIDADMTIDEDDELGYIFDSAWAPPTEWLGIICKDFKELSFVLKYEEPGMCFMGVMKAEGGKVTQDETLEY